MLEVKELVKDFGSFRALDRVSLRVEEGMIHALIGPNGAGKTTLLNMISGIYDTTGGEIVYKGVHLDGLRPHRRTALGIGRTFQNIRLFNSMTVLENVMVGHHCRTRAGILANLLRSPFRELAEERDTRSKAMEMLKLTGLEESTHLWAGHLPYAAQRRLELARVLAIEPDLLLLDEPAAGMNPKETWELSNLITMMREMGKTILLIEHNMNLVMDISDRVTVLNFGRKISEGNPDQVRKDPKVVEAYLGKPEEVSGLPAADAR